MTGIYLLQKIKEFFKPNTPKSDLEKSVSLDEPDEGIIERKITEYCERNRVSRKQFFKIFYKEVQQTAKRAAYRMRVNNGGFIHDFG